MIHPADPTPHSDLRFGRRGVFVALASLLAAPAVAQDTTPVFTLTVRNRKFEPASLEVPAGQKIELRITNADAKPIEFESADLRREKVIAPGQTASVFVGPLRAGKYEFLDDFQPTNRGHLIAR